MNPSTTAFPSTKTAESRAAEARSADSGNAPDRVAVVPRWRSALNRRGDALRWGRPALLVLMALLLAGLGAALACLRATPEPTSTGIDLPAEPPSLNLNLSSAEAPPSPTAPAPHSESDRANVVVPELVAPALSAPLSVAVTLPEQKAPEPVIATPPATPVVVVPATVGLGHAGAVIPTPANSWENCYAIRTPHRGDSPMIRTWNALGLPFVLAGALTVPAVAGQAAEPNRDDVIIRHLSELRTAVEALTKAVKEFQSASLNTDLEVQRSKGEIAEIRRTIAQLRQDLDNMNQRQATERRSAYPPNPPAQTGRIRLVNTYMQPVTITLNGRAYPLLPGDTRMIDAVPAGPFTYEVLGIVGATNRTLDANETFTITVHPR